MLSPKLRLMPGTDITDTPMLMEVTEPMVMDTPTITMERGQFLRILIDMVQCVLVSSCLIVSKSSKFSSKCY